MQLVQLLRRSLISQTFSSVAKFYIDMMNEVESLYILMYIPPHYANAGIDTDEHHEARQ